MKKDPMPLWLAIGMLIIGILLGNVFAFGMQFWNASVDRASCALIETQFLAYDEIRQPRHPMEIKEIAVDCANGQRYFVDGVSINSELVKALSELQEQENIVLLIHPNSNTIVEFNAGSVTLLEFGVTIEKLGREATGFLFLGVFMYFCAFVGLCYAVLHGISKRKSKR